MVKETKCSSLARNELQSLKDPIINGTGNASAETTQQQKAASNGVVKALVQPMATSMGKTPTSLVANNVPENGEIKLKVEKDI
ncbi:hypothetical protein Lalb_Chr16g0388111 [Lupinus albus]|uniref:Uncharacterized protein n=1 Tax=Lupinus albus TaxID=3870 RepID=A0A6A4PCF9_LUPAL|nr:hypothetical protein Lalb_Chr16g0388111 [Lupinus albus]